MEKKCVSQNVTVINQRKKRYMPSMHGLEDTKSKTEK